MYEVEFLDGQVAEYSVNIIAENMYTQCNAEGNQYLLLNEVIDWRRDNNTAVACNDMYVYSHNSIDIIMEVLTLSSHLALP
jgi:hypothetical protein